MKTLVIAPHPDDETLGCGGALFAHLSQGHETYWLICTTISEGDEWPNETVDRRGQEIAKIKDLYCFSGVFQLNLPPTKVDQEPLSSLVQMIGDVYETVQPEVVYVPYASDVHTDHRRIAEALGSTLKWFRYPHIRKVMMYETPSETEFNFLIPSCFKPNVFVDISNHLDQKIEAMKIYESEIGEFPFPRSEETLRALAALRGSQCGCNSAEGFQLVYEKL